MAKLIMFVIETTTQMSMLVASVSTVTRIAVQMVDRTTAVIVSVFATTIIVDRMNVSIATTVSSMYSVDMVVVECLCITTVTVSVMNVNGVVEDRIG